MAIDNTARRRSSRIIAMDEKKKESKNKSANPDNKNKEQRKEIPIDIDDLCFIFESESESDHDNDYKPYSPARSRKRPNYKSLKQLTSSTQKRQNPGSSSTSRTNELSPNDAPEMDGPQHVYDVLQRGDPVEIHAQPVNDPNMEPSSYNTLAASPSGEGEQPTTEAGHASFCPKFAGENIDTHSTELAKEKRDNPLCAEDINTQSNNKQQERVAAEDATTARKVQHLKFRQLFNGETSTPSPANDVIHKGGDGRAAGIRSHPSETEIGKGKMPLHSPKLLVDAMKSVNPLNSKPLVLPSQEANLYANNSLYGTMNRAPATQRANPFTFTYYDLQKGVGMLNPMGPFPMQQPNSLSAELMPLSSRFMEMWMQNRSRSQPQGEHNEARNVEVDNDNEELDLELRL